MSGKAILIVTVAFSAIMLIFGHNFIAIAGRTVENSTNYELDYKMTNLAISGVEYGMSLVYQDPSFQNSMQIDYNDETSITITVTNLPYSMKNVRCVASSDYGKYESYTANAVLRTSSWANFAYYSQNENGNIRFYSGDVINGPLHTQDPLGFLVSGNPTFEGRVTLLSSSYRKVHTSDNPSFNQGIFYNINNPLDGPHATKSLQAYNAAAVKISPSGTGNTVTLEYLHNNSVRYKVNSGNWVNVNLGSLNPPVIGVQNAKLRIDRANGSPTINNPTGVTFVCIGSGSLADADNQTLSGNGHILIDDNIIRNGSCTGKIGLVAENNILVSEAYGDLNQNITIHAAIYCEKGGFGIENYAGYPGYSGKKINISGSLIQNVRRFVGKGYEREGGFDLVKGFDKNYVWEDDLAYNIPPHFPGSGEYTVASYLRSVSKTPR